MSLDLAYAEAEDLANLVRDSSKVPGVDYLVLDVRGDDFAGGHIKGAHNIRYDILPTQMEETVEKFKSIPQIYFHCVRSRGRGPRLARQYQECLVKSDHSANQKVIVLRNGFFGWQNKFRGSEPELIEDFDLSVWENVFE